MSDERDIVDESDRDEMLLDVHRAMRRSNYVLSSGKASREYVDFDGYFLGGHGDCDFDQQRAQRRKWRASPSLSCAAGQPMRSSGLTTADIVSGQRLHKNRG